MKEFFKKIGRGIVKGAIYIYCKVVYRVKVVGKENIPKKHWENRCFLYFRIVNRLAKLVPQIWNNHTKSKMQRK